MPRALMTFLLGGCLAGSAFAGPAGPAGPAQVRPQLGHDVWGFKEGAPEPVVALAQTGDGYLWVAGSNSLSRFDGVRFEPFRPPAGTQLASTGLSSLFAPASGGLWIGYRFGGFSFLKDGRLTHYPDDAAPTATIAGFAQGPDGILWALSTLGLWRFDGTRWEQVGTVPPAARGVMGFDRSGWLWVIVKSTLLFVRPGERRLETAEDLSAVDLGDVSGFTIDADDYVVTTTSWKPRVAPANGGPPGYPLMKDHCDQRLDRNGGLWILYRNLAHLMLNRPLEEVLAGARLEARGRAYAYGERSRIVVADDGSPVDNYEISVNSAHLNDREGNVWIGGERGLHRFYQKAFVSLDVGLAGPVAVASDAQGGAWLGSQASPLFHLTAENPGSIGPKVPGWTEMGGDNWPVSAMYRAPDGTLWLAANGLWHESLSPRRPAKESSKGSKLLDMLRQRTGHDWVEIDLPPEVAEKKMYLQAMTLDPAGGLWVSLGRQGLYRFADGVWTLAGGRKDLPNGVLSEHTDTLGRVWFGCTKNRVAVLDGDTVRLFGPDDGLRVGNVMAFAGRGPDLWVAGDFGLQRFSGGRFKNVQPADDGLLQGISGIVEKADGDLWLNGLSGIVHLDHAEVAAALGDAERRVTGSRLGVRDGLPGFAAQIRPLPSVVEGTDGRLWFAVNNGCVVVDPGRAMHRGPALPAAIQSVSADDVPFDLKGPLRFPAGTSTVQISFVAVSLTAPEAVRYRYRMREVDPDWHETRAAVPVAWRNLAPGAYHFSVGASDTNGAWTNDLATVEFTLLPAFYQTTWFALLCAAAGAAAVSLLFLLRLGQATRRVRMQMEARLAERERIARALHDTLLQGMTGLLLRVQAAVNRLPAREPVRDSLEEALARGDQMLVEGRDAVRGLRGAAQGPDNLEAACADAVETLKRGGSADAGVAVLGSPQALHPVVREEAFQIAREAVTNAFAHAGAARIDLELDYGPRAFRVRVRDDGRGIDAAILERGGRENHFGLQGMRERARRIDAQFALSRRPQGGTEVVLTVPGATAYVADENGRGSWLGRLSGRRSRTARSWQDPVSPE